MKSKKSHFSKKPVISQAPKDGKVVLFGTHSVEAALKNEGRKIHRVLALRDRSSEFEVLASDRGIHIEITDRDNLMTLLPPGAVHQGIAAVVSPLPILHLDDFCEELGENALVVILDQVTDPHNVGAVLRSAGAFGASGLLMTERNAPPLSGVLAKSASGALEIVPVIQVVNLSQTLATLKEHGFWCYGLAEQGEQTLDKLKLNGRIALVFGSEGSGMRRLTREGCDVLVRLPTSEQFSTLNISNAAAISMYEVFRQNS